MSIGELKIITALWLVCLTPVFLVYSAWMLFKFTLGLVVLLLMALLIHTLFGFAKDVELGRRLFMHCHICCRILDLETFPIRSNSSLKRTVETRLCRKPRSSIPTPIGIV
jgi:hypothetical protein